MFHINFSLFSQTKALENKIDMFHDKLLDAAMTFKKAVAIYLEQQRSDEFKKASKQIKQIEHDADNLRREIENNLYSQNLIPDLRADVLHLVENLDKVINKFDEVIFCIIVDDKENNIKNIVLINPRWIALSNNTDVLNEGCLSVPSFSKRIERYANIEVEAFDENMNSIKFIANGFFARVIQHECDHLIGKMICDY
jgi:peptide deformylase